MKNAAQDALIAAATAVRVAQQDVEQVRAQIRRVGEISQGVGNAETSLSDLRQARAQCLARALLSGTVADTKAIDQKIAEALSMVTRLQDQADAATAATKILADQESKVQSTLDAAFADLHREVWTKCSAAFNDAQTRYDRAVNDLAASLGQMNGALDAFERSRPGAIVGYGVTKHLRDLASLLAAAEVPDYRRPASMTGRVFVDLQALSLDARHATADALAAELNSAGAL